jgi:plastocyanin
MTWSHARFARQSLRAATVCGLVAVLAGTAVPSAAQSGASTPPNCVIQLSVANPTPGDQEVPHALQMSGTALDDTASFGSGISNVQIFLGNRDAGGLFLGSTTLSGGAWSIITSIPDNLNGGQNLVVYGTSSVSGQQAFVSIPVVVGESASAENPPSDQSQSFCPATITPTPVPTIAPTVQPTVPVVPTVAPTAQPAAPTPQPTPQTAPTAAPTSVPAPPPQAAQIQLAISSPASPPLSFDTTMLSAAAGANVTVTYTNNEPGVPHNWHVFNGPDSSAPTLAETQIITGPGTSDSTTFTAPTQPGDYFFWCDVHPTIMTGTFVVTSGG